MWARISLIRSVGGLWIDGPDGRQRGLILGLPVSQDIPADDGDLVRAGCETDQVERNLGRAGAAPRTAVQSVTVFGDSGSADVSVAVLLDVTAEGIPAIVAPAGIRAPMSAPLGP